MQESTIVRADLGVNETGEGTNVVQESTNVEVNLGVNETYVGTNVVQESINVKADLGVNETNVGIIVDDEGTNCDNEENVGTTEELNRIDGEIIVDDEDMSTKDKAKGKANGREKGKGNMERSVSLDVVNEGRNLKFKKNDKRRMRVKCKDGCPWKVYCANIKGKNIQSNVRESPNLKLSDIMEKTHEKWNVGINKTLAYRAKTLVVDIMDGSFMEQYRGIHNYGHELLRTNPGSTVKIISQPFQGEEENSEHPEKQMNPHFQRMYICFKSCKEKNFKCKPIIRLNGCFLKGYYDGQKLVSIGRDPNDPMLQIAYDVVEGETKDSWSWFLELLTADLGGVRLCKTYTFISDQQKATGKKDASSHTAFRIID
ncbi:uncharacterized protein LOC127137673 [Lathyrus oleraceus]|uniref:uncharacterized protein LOC127137673 n=1 Tax=Pisum sativum TaxID=3888 RepID=UPI0021D388F8|nr:uncharacterized protein LOC127137673 [Pisum sativum]